MKRFKCLMLASAGLLAACGGAIPLRPTTSSQLKEAWNPRNDPTTLGGDYQLKFSELPARGQVNTLPWSDDYWPDNKGGIAARWHGKGEAFSYTPPSKNQVQAMDVASLAALSPAEKYDIYKGRFDYPTVSRERQRTHKSSADWEGLCHGWAPAAILYPEPQATLATSRDGIKVPFGSSDLKALLTYYQGDIADAPSRSLGERCDIDLHKHPRHGRDPECRDVNAGAFHVILANHLGLLGEAFVADMTRDKEVWNQPVYGFTSKVVKTQEPSPGAAAGTAREVVVKTTVRYTQETDPTWNALNGSKDYGAAENAYQYRLELDEDGVILGGEWLEFDRPDFLWTQGRPKFTGYFGAIGHLARESTKGESLPDPVKP